MKFKVSDIKYDTDGIDIKLPTSIIIEADNEDEVADAISDEVGWCIISIGKIISNEY